MPSNSVAQLTDCVCARHAGGFNAYLCSTDEVVDVTCAVQMK